MKLVVGLGNPGDKYKYTRHNVGFIVLDYLAQFNNLTWEHNKKVRGEFASFRAGGEKGVIFLKPLTYMNNSGDSVKQALSYFSVGIKDLLVIHDDVDLGPFVVKKVFNVSSAGHHGVEDIIKKLGTQEFERIRIGVGRPKGKAGESIYNVENYVLSDFSSQELEKLREITKEYILSSLII